MRDFGEKLWAPAGSRPHIFLTPGPALTGLCENVLDEAGPLSAWYPGWPAVVRAVDRDARHVTLGWVDLPTAAAVPGTWQGLAAALEREVAEIAPVTLTAEKLVTTSHGVIVTIAATPELNCLADAVEHSMDAVFGAGVRTVTDRSPHLALVYGRAHADTPELSIPIRSTSDTVHSLLLVDHDTFGSGRWNPTTAHSIALTAQHDTHPPHPGNATGVRPGCAAETEG